MEQIDRTILGCDLPHDLRSIKKGDAAVEMLQVRYRFESQ
jgi:hypothetical protein